MSLVTVDFETAFRSRLNKGTIGPCYSLKSWTYDEFFSGSKILTTGEVTEIFKVQGVGIKIDDKPTQWIDAENTEQHLRNLFPEGNTHTLIAHNGYFDYAILEWIYGLQAKRYYCTQSMSRAVWPQHSASLDALTRRCFPDNPDNWKQKEDLDYVDGYWELSEEQNFILGEYCKQDVDITHYAFREMWRMGFPAKELDVIDITIKMFTRRPFELDRPMLLEYQDKVVSERTRILADAGVPRATLSSTKKFPEYLEQEHGIVIKPIASPTEKNPDNMKIPLSQEDMAYIELQAAHPELKHIWEGRRIAASNQEVTRIVRFLNHAQITPINPLGRLPSYIGYYHAHTGRWGGGNKTNHQNLGRLSLLRPSLQAPAGYKVIVRDLSNIEARVNAWFCGQFDLLESIRGGVDVYNEIATEIYGYPVFRKRNEPEHKGPGFVGKVAILGLGYNMGVPRFRHTLATGAMGMAVLLDHQTCEKTVTHYRTKNHKIVTMWRELQHVLGDMTNPDIEPYHIGTNNCIRVEHSRLVLPNGLALNYPQLKAVDHPQAYNEFVYWNGEYWKKIYGAAMLENIIQALSRLVMSDAMVKTQRQWDEDNTGNIALTVHDELVGVVREEKAEAAFALLGDEMTVTPAWADERLFLQTEGGISDRYNK